MHDVVVRNVAVGEHHFVDGFRADQGDELGFGIDGDAFGVQFPCKLRGISPAFDVGYLRRREAVHLDGRVFAVADVEIVEIPPRGSHDEYTFSGHDALRSPG